LVPPLRDGEREWLGGAQRLQYRKAGRLVWDQSYGTGLVDACPPTLQSHGGVEHLLVAGTWLRGVGAEQGQFTSLVAVDPETGEEQFRVPVAGVSAPPTVTDGVAYVVGQWREVIAVELATGRELWRERSQTETAGLSYHDAQVGGGWSVCPAAVGRHVWTVNARGDLFGYDRHTGEARWVHAAAVPLNNRPVCPYAPTRLRSFRLHSGALRGG
jgi:outer membrane protein assembly factor BamB